jgi:hypothetical protein
MIFTKFVNPGYIAKFDNSDYKTPSLGVQLMDFLDIVGFDEA